MNLNFKLSRKALEDINAIWDYTAEHWSEEQADTYYSQIFESIDAICHQPFLGSSLEEVKKLHRKFPIGSHLIIYQKKDNHILIDRVLHQRMDIDRMDIDDHLDI